MLFSTYVFPGDCVQTMLGGAETVLASETVLDLCSGLLLGYITLPLRLYPASVS